MSASQNGMKCVVSTVLFAACLLVAVPGLAQQEKPLHKVTIPSTLDGHQQPARFFVSEEATEEPRPLLVVLHTWSGNYKQSIKIKDLVVPACRRRGWSMIMPNFRGPNRRPKACASPYAIQDVKDAVEFAKENARIDSDRVYLFGASGGGHMSLMMACKAPDLWAGVSSWVPISDLAAWHRQTRNSGLDYWKDLEKVFGGPPSTSEQMRMAYRERSPLFHLHQAQGVTIEMNAGIHDGHGSQSVPVSHTLHAFNKLATVNGKPEKQIHPEHIQTIVEEQTVPEPLRARPGRLAYREHEVLFYREAGPVRVTIFDGGHTGEQSSAIHWLSEQRRGE